MVLLVLINDVDSCCLFLVVITYQPSVRMTGLKASHQVFEAVLVGAIQHDKDYQILKLSILAG